MRLLIKFKTANLMAAKVKYKKLTTPGIQGDRTLHLEKSFGIRSGRTDETDELSMISANIRLFIGSIKRLLTQHMGRRHGYNRGFCRCSICTGNEKSYFRNPYSRSIIEFSKDLLIRRLISCDKNSLLLYCVIRNFIPLIEIKFHKFYKRTPSSLSYITLHSAIQPNKRKNLFLFSLLKKQDKQNDRFQTEKIHQKLVYLS